MSHAPTTPSGLDPVSELLPAFQFEFLIAHGKSGAVFKARQRSLDRAVAIRIFPRALAGDRPPLTSARAMAGLSHPNLIRIFDSGEVDGRPYMVMEFVPGKSLRRSARGQAIDPRQAAGIVMAASEGLAHAHANGISHGAISPSNILLTPKCEPKIGNFGFGEEPGEDSGAYKAPEIGGGFSSCSPSSDVFALGVILHELLTGFPGGGVLPDLRLAAICRKATHPDPSQRYTDASALAAGLSRWLTPAPKTVSSPMITRQPALLHRPKPALALSPGHALVRNCAVIAFLLFSIYGLWGFYQAKQERLSQLQEQENAKPRVVIVKQQPHTASALVRWDP